MESDEHQADEKCTEKNGSRDGSPGIANLVADVANVVITQVGIHRQDHDLAQAKPKMIRPRCGLPGVIENHLAMKVSAACQQDPGNCPQDSQPKCHCPLSQRRDATMQEQQQAYDDESPQYPRRPNRNRQGFRFFAVIPGADLGGESFLIIELFPTWM